MTVRIFFSLSLSLCTASIHISEIKMKPTNRKKTLSMHFKGGGEFVKKNIWQLPFEFLKQPR